MTLLICAFSIKSYSQQVEHPITLICDTDKLKNMKPKNAYKACYFQGQTESDSRKFTVTGNLNDTFVWNGKASSGTDELNITKIKYEKGTKIFKNDSIEGTNTVRAVAKKSTKNKDPYTYIIYFKVNNKKKYHIDPKVRIRE